MEIFSRTEPVSMTLCIRVFFEIGCVIYKHLQNIDMGGGEGLALDDFVDEVVG